MGVSWHVSEGYDVAQAVPQKHWKPHSAHAHKYPPSYKSRRGPSLSLLGLALRVAQSFCIKCGDDFECVESFLESDIVVVTLSCVFSKQTHTPAKNSIDLKC